MATGSRWRPWSRSSVGAAAAGREDGRQRGRRDHRRRVGRLRRGRGGGDRRPGAARGRAAAGCTSGSPTRRRGTSVCRAAARSTCGCRSTRRDASAEIASAGGRAAEVTLLEGDGSGAKLLFEADGTRSGTLGSPELDAEAGAAGRGAAVGRASELQGPLFVDVVAPAPRLIMFGAVPIAAALCTLSRAAGWRPFVVDPRARFATPARFPDAEQVFAAWPEDAFAQLGGIDPATSIVVLTHDPKLDDAALLIALRSQARLRRRDGLAPRPGVRRERLLAAGMDESELSASGGAGRAGSRRGQRRGDGAVDPGRGGGHAARARGRPAGGGRGTDPRGRRLSARDDRRLVLAAGAGVRFGSGSDSKQAARRARRTAAAGVGCGARRAPCRRWSGWSSCWARAPTSPARSICTARRAGRVRGVGARAGGVAALRARGAGATARRWS